jgi:hypothetical protein
MDPSKSVNTRPSVLADYLKLLQPYMYIALSACLFALLGALSGGSGQGLFVALLFALLISYTIVYHTKLLLYSFFAISLLGYIPTFLPIEYRSPFSSSYFSHAIMYIWASILFLPLLYDFYMYYNNKQALSSIPAQKGGSSHKRRK